MSSSSSKQLMDLPNEMLEHLAKFLDKKALYSFASADPRLQAVSQHLSSMDRVETTHITGSLLRFVTPRASEVRVLNLSDCWSESGELRSLILECRCLSELNVVNSSLKLQHLLDVTAGLQELTNLSATINEGSDHVVFGSYPSLRRAYLEFAPQNAVIDSVVGFLEACPGVNYLHLTPIGSTTEPFDADGSTLSVERLEQYETLIISTELMSRSRPLRMKLFFRFLKNVEFMYRHFALNSAMRHSCWFERANFDEDEEEEEIDAQPGTLSHAYPVQHVFGTGEFEFLDSFRDGQIGLRLDIYGQAAIMMPNMEMFSTLAELDFTGAHITYSVESWKSLVETAPAVKALALPNCSVFADRDGHPQVDESALDLLSKLTLKQFYVGAKDPECENCFERKLTGTALKFLTSFKTLEELVVDGIGVTEDFFERVHEPCSLKSLKIKLLSQPSFEPFAKSLQAFRKLKTLKLEAYRLPLHSELIWDALSSIGLKQLCLSSKSTEPIELAVLRSTLPRLLASLDVFHLHAKLSSGNVDVQSILEQEVQKANLLKKIDPVRFVGWEQASLSSIETSKMTQFAGRSVCLLKSFIGKLKPVGWST